MPQHLTRSIGALVLVLLTFAGCDLRGIAYDDNDVPAIITQEFGVDGDAAVRVARCESTLNPQAVSPDGRNFGLFQINRVHAADFADVTGHPWGDVLDPYLNTVYAKHLHDEQGWRPWSCRWAA